MTFDGTHFFKADGTKLGIKASVKSGRWSFRDERTNRLYASGISPEQFAKEFWCATLNR